MKKIGKFLCLAMCAGLAVTAFAACGENPNPDDGGKTAEDVTLVIWLPAEDREFGESVAEAFQAAHPEKEYTFLFGAQSESDCGTTILNDVTNAPDCFAFASDQMLKLINGGALNQIGGSRLERLKAANTPESIDAASIDYNGDIQTYAMPYTDNTYFLYYNKSKLNENDIKTIDGILEKCDATHQFAYPLNDGWYSSAFYFGAGCGYEVKYDDAWGETMINTDIDNTTGQKVAQAMLDYVLNPAFKPDSDDSKIVAGFQDGSVLAGVSGVWNRNSIMEALGDDFGVAALPTYTFDSATNEQKPLVAFAGYKLMGVCEYSKVKSDALAFAEFFTNYDNQIGHFEARGFTPTNIEAAKEPKVTADPCAIATKAVLQNSKTQKNVPTTWWTPLQSFVNDMITKKKNFSMKSEIDSMVKNIKKNVS